MNHTSKGITIIRATEVRPAGGGCVAYRYVLAHQSEGGAPYVVWMECFPSGPGARPYFGQGDYYAATNEELDAAHKRYGQRRDRDSLLDAQPPFTAPATGEEARALNQGES